LCSSRGYDVTMVKDATASFTEEQMQAALPINLPNYANAMVTTEQIVGSIAFLKPLGASA
jgi:ureidoacrylate peracid hydrolase